MLRQGDLPGLDVLASDFGVVYVDAGARSGGLGPEAFVVKLAILARRHSGLAVSERVYHPVPDTRSGSAAPPLFIGLGGERARQATGYVIELASLLSVAMEPGGVFGDGFDGPLLLVRHGPLFQLLHQYLSRPYIVSRDQAMGMLLYAGLEEGRARELLDYSSLCLKGGRRDYNYVVLGLLAARLLAELVGLAGSGSGIGVAGMVEDVSRSRSFVAATAARLLRQALGSLGQGVDLSRVARPLRDYAYKYYEGYGSQVSRCLCPGTNLDDLLDSKREWEELLAATRREVSARFSIGVSAARLEQLEAALLWSGSLPEMADSDLVYLLYYLLGGNYYPATTPLSSGARLALLRYYLERYDTIKCHLDELEPVLRGLERIKYQYLAPVRPPSCSELEAQLQQRGLASQYMPCELSSLYTVPPAIRLEYIESMPLLDQARALAVYPARITIYGYPPQLLVVDKYSRISVEEMAAFHEIVSGLVERIRPYSSFLRDWETRISTTI